MTMQEEKNDLTNINSDTCIQILQVESWQFLKDSEEKGTKND